MSSSAAAGAKALDAKDYTSAINHLTTALQSSASPLWLLHRSTAYQRSGQYSLALEDAEQALLQASARHRREQIAKAQMRRAIALHGLQRYGDARMCLTWCAKGNEKEKGLTLWVAKVKADYDRAGGDEAECNAVRVQQLPSVQAQTVEVAGRAKEGAEMSTTTTTATVSAQTPKEKIRHEWYQSNQSVTITVFAKGVPKDQTEIILDEGSVSSERDITTKQY